MAGIQRALISHVSLPRAYRIAVLDTPPRLLPGEAREERAQIDSTRAASSVAISPRSRARTWARVSISRAKIWGVWAAERRSRGKECAILPSTTSFTLSRIGTIGIAAPVARAAVSTRSIRAGRTRTRATSCTAT